jgi:SAM-dependent methyltransferase
MTSVSDPLAGSPWSRPETVAGFKASPPNATLLRFAHDERQSTLNPRALDIGCGTGRNAIPLAAQGWNVLGIDLSWPMLEAAEERSRQCQLDRRFSAALASMEQLPVADRSCELVIAHGIWNLARSGREFRRGVLEAARVAAPGAALFVFTFSRNTLPAGARPIAGESFVFTQFSGEPQCFLTADELVAELASVGFVLDPGRPLRELNTPSSTGLGASHTPVIYEGTFRYRG